VSGRASRAGSQRRSVGVGLRERSEMLQCAASWRPMRAAVALVTIAARAVYIDGVAYTDAIGNYWVRAHRMAGTAPTDGRPDTVTSEIRARIRTTTSSGGLAVRRIVAAVTPSGARLTAVVVDLPDASARAVRRMR
jgi:hypothetical protein